MVTKEQAREQIRQLVEKFSAIPEIRNASERQIQSYILRLFEILGWDIHNPNEVRAEEKIVRGYADFVFYLSGIPVFCIETKKVSVHLNRSEHVKQAINYAWLKGMTWTVLTNFETLQIFNADWRELNPLYAKFRDIECKDYAESRFDELWLLSRESMQKRELDKLAEVEGEKRQKKPTVQQALFSQMTEWRKELFKEMRAFNGNYTKDLSVIDDAVQKLLDRLIFIRTVEDRSLEERHLERELHQYDEQKGSKQTLFKNLVDLFEKLDGIYNAHLFAKHPLDDMEINDVGLLKRIIQGLYQVKGEYAEYDFKVIDADVLGTIYEQYLAFKAHDPEGKQFIDIQKRAKRKSQGIYYTPQYIVRYIVQQTLGKLLEEGADPYKIRILDPSCGSGSFLLEAFDVLDRYLAKHGCPEHQKNHRERRLYILYNNIFGVDLDPQAVEVARLNLVLRTATEKARLPVLDKNIQTGNSLIDDPYLAGERAFRWSEAFPSVMAEGGFDVIIGNPPYIRQEALDAVFKVYARQHFETYTGTADLYVYFIEKAHQLLRENGRFAMITSNKFMRSNYGKALRRFLAEKTTLQAIVDFGELPVFQDAATFPAILVTKNHVPDKQKFIYAPIKHLNFNLLEDEVEIQGYEVDERSLQGKNWSLVKQEEASFLDKIRASGISLLDYVDGNIYRGIVTGNNKVFVIDEIARDRLLAKDPRSAEVIKPFVFGDDVRKYRIFFKNKYLLFTRRGINIENYPAIKEYLAQYQDELMPRPKAWKGENWSGRKPGAYEWYEIQDTINYYEFFEKPKIVYPDIAKESRAAFDTTGLYLANTVYFIPRNDLYLLGLLNSKLIFAYYKRIAAVIGDADKGGRLRWFRQDVRHIPIRKINFDDPSDKEKHDRLVSLVEEMLRLKKEHIVPETLFDAPGPDFSKQIADLDRQIDALVYELYNLTDSEIALVEGTSG